MFLEKRQDGAHALVGGAARFVAVNDGQRLALIKWCLGMERADKRSEVQRNGNRNNLETSLHVSL
jgi:hypothetical protein